MSSLFLSHSHKDKGFVRLLAFDLRMLGVEVWHDEDEILRADLHVLKIESALEATQYVGACLSPNSVPSKWVKKEISVALAREINEGRIVVLPLLMRDCEIPLFLKDKTFTDFRNPATYESEFQSLLQSIKPEALSETCDIRSALTIDDARRRSLVGAAVATRSPNAVAVADDDEWVRVWVTEYLIGRRPLCSDDSECYWIYVGLGEVGGPRAEDVLRRGLSDDGELARRGAQQGLRLMGVKL